MNPILIYLGAGKGWRCESHKFDCMGRIDAETHAAREHGADPVIDDAGDVYDSRESSVLRAGGLI